MKLFVLKIMKDLALNRRPRNRPCALCLSSSPPSPDCQNLVISTISNSIPNNCYDLEVSKSKGSTNPGKEVLLVLGLV